MKPILQLDIELISDQVKQMKGATKILESMAKKGKPGAFIAQIYYTGNEINAVNRAMNYSPRIKCYVIPSYLFNRIKRIIDKAMNPGNKIPRRNYYEAARTGILKYIKTEIKRKPKFHITEVNSRKPYGGRFEDPFPTDDDIPF